MAGCTDLFSKWLNIFVDEDYPLFINKYLYTKTLERIKHVTQFCGCDYTKLYSPLFLYTRFFHSLVVAHMTWHFTHDKKATIAALLHDVGTPCFAHCIDYVFGDYLKQESSERSIREMIKNDSELLGYLEEDGITLEELENLELYPVLENDSPKLCTDRLDGVLHTCYIWLHTNSIEEIKEVYDDMVVLTNEEGKPEIGFKTYEIAEKFAHMVITYAKELQGNTDKYIMKYVSEIVKASFDKGYLTLDDLYTKKETEIVDMFSKQFPSWIEFNNADTLERTDEEPDNFSISFATKKRNVIPLVVYDGKVSRITDISDDIRKLYEDLDNYHDTKYAYVKTIKTINQTIN